MVLGPSDSKCRLASDGGDGATGGSRAAADSEGGDAFLVLVGNVMASVSAREEAGCGAGAGGGGDVGLSLGLRVRVDGDTADGSGEARDSDATAWAWGQEAGSWKTSSEVGAPRKAWSSGCSWRSWV